jgi:hypothetical protein
VPETTEAYEDLRGMNPGAPVGMLDSGTPGEPEGYEFVMLRLENQIRSQWYFAGSRRQDNVLKSWPDISPLS